MKFSNSKDASRLMCVAGQSEPSALSGLYLGKTKKYSLPFFLDLNALVSPHVAVMGMTGSGKSYLMKSLIARAGLAGGIGVVVLDWNGEYSGVISSYGTEHKCKDADGAKDLTRMALSSGRGVFGFNLSGIERRGEREAMARIILSTTVDLLSKQERGDSVHHIIVLDEAWKVVHGGEVGALFREARKYGIAIIAASQGANDVSNEIMANASCIIAFRMQSEADFSALRKAEIICDDDIATVASLDVGACLVILKLRESGGTPSRVVIGRVHGAFERHIVVIRDDDMEFEVAAEKIASETAVISDDEKIKAGVYSFIGERKEIDLTDFIGALRRLGLKRPEIVTYMRRLGVDDMCVVKAYSESSCVAFEV